MKKLLVFGVIVLFLGLAISFSTGNFIEKKSIFVKEIDISPCYMKSNNPIVVTLEKSSNIRISSRDSYIIYDTEYDDYHPTLAGDTSGRFFACFEISIDGVDYYPDFWYSLDDGMTWEEAGYFAESEGAAYPDVDSNDSGFYGTFSPSKYYSGNQWLIIAEDLMAITGRMWDWSPGFDDFKFMTISCCNSGYVMAATGDKNTFEELDDCPLLFDKRGISWLGLEGYLHTDISIDDITEISYAVYDHTIDADLLVRKDNFTTGEHIGSFIVGNGGNKIRNPSIEAHDSAVVLVCEEERDIVCFYSSNGFLTVQKSIVVTSAQFPEVKVTFDGDIFACSYVKNDIVYCKTSIDGGATWEEELEIVNCDVMIEYGTHDLARSWKGFCSVWEDKRMGDIDIYFNWFEYKHPAHLEITVHQGFHIGVLADIVNWGCGDGEDVEWSIILERGIIFKGRDSSGTIELILVDKDVAIRTKGLFGIGNVNITVTTEPSYGEGDTQIEDGFVFGPFVFI